MLTVSDISVNADRQRYNTVNADCHRYNSSNTNTSDLTMLTLKV